MEDDNNTASKLIEIKEILERVKKHYVLDEIQDNLLLDYITNLQQENEELKEYLKTMEKGKDNNLNRFLDYKSRIEKAVEYIKKCQLGVDSMDRPVMLANEDEGKILLNILNDRSDE